MKRLIVGDDYFYLNEEDFISTQAFERVCNELASLIVAMESPKEKLVIRKIRLQEMEPKIINIWLAGE